MEHSKNDFETFIASLPSKIVEHINMPDVMEGDLDEKKIELYLNTLLKYCKDDIWNIESIVDFFDNAPAKSTITQLRLSFLANQVFFSLITQVCIFLFNMIYLFLVIRFQVCSKKQ